MKRSLPVGLLLSQRLRFAAHALPRGYKDDFNGCSQQSASPEDRQRCCMETFRTATRSAEGLRG
jgi:hypothetical protein